MLKNLKYYCVFTNLNHNYMTHDETPVPRPDFYTARENIRVNGKRVNELSPSSEINVTRNSLL